MCRRWLCVGQGGAVAALRAPEFTEMRDDCPDQYYVKDSRCRQISSRRRLYRTNEGQGRSVPGGGILPFGRGKPSINRVHARCLLNTTPKVNEESQNFVSTVQCSLVHAYRTQRASANPSSLVSTTGVLGNLGLRRIRGHQALRETPTNSKSAYKVRPFSTVDHELTLR